MLPAFISLEIDCFHSQSTVNCIAGLNRRAGYATGVWELLEKRRVEMKARMYKTVNKLAPSRLCDLFQNVNKINDYNLRGSSARVYIPMPKTEFLKQSFCCDGAKIWNQIPDEIRNSASLTSFCSKLSSSTFDLS